MALIRIPERQLDGFIALLSLSDEQVDALISALEHDAPPKLLPLSIAKGIADAVPGISFADLSKIVETALGLYFTRLHQEASPESLAKEVYEAIRGSGVKQFDPLIENEEKVTARLSKLLGIESLNTLSKALVVLQANENMFHDARIVTEIRPIFGSNPENAPTAAIVMHMLNVTFHRRTDLKEFYVALDVKDLNEMKEAIDRAIAKEKSIRSLLEASNISNISLD